MGSPCPCPRAPGKQSTPGLFCLVQARSQGREGARAWAEALLRKPGDQTSWETN